MPAESTGASVATPVVCTACARKTPCRNNLEEFPFPLVHVLVCEHRAEGGFVDELWRKTRSHNVVRTRHAFYAVALGETTKDKTP